MDRLLYTPEEAAQILNVGRSRVFELLRTGELRSVQFGRTRRVTRDALVELVASMSADGKTV